MLAPALTDGVHDLNEGSWIYLSLWDSGLHMDSGLHRRVVEACELSGWPAVSWSPSRHGANDYDSARFFEGMSHAVEHADVVVVLMNGSSAMTDAELAFAYRHRRPVIGLHFEKETGSSEVQAMLERYGRARLVACADVDDCAAGLREALADPEFAATIREAVGEQVGHV